MRKCVKVHLRMGGNVQQLNILDPRRMRNYNKEEDVDFQMLKMHGCQSKK